jgi:hypothetical protein
MLATLSTDARWVFVAFVAAYLAFLCGMVGLWRLGAAAKHWQDQSVRRSPPPPSASATSEYVDAERWRNMSDADRTYLLALGYLPPPGSKPPGDSNP